MDRFIPSRWLRVRAFGAVALLMAGLGLLMYRAWVLQVREAERLRAMAEEQYMRDVEIPPRRGRILDRNGIELAASAEIESLACNQRLLSDKAGDVARQLAGPLHTDAHELEKHLRGRRYFSWVKRRLDPDEARAVRELAVHGLTLVREPRRYYPHRELAGPLLGWAGVDAVGQEGLELQHDKILRGTCSQVAGLIDALGRAVLIDGISDTSNAGRDVEVTIDRHIQFRLEAALSRAVAAHHAKAGSAVVLDPRNGEVLAIAAVPTLNPNDPGDAPSHGARLRAITDPFEPGSTMKTFVIAGALEAGITRPDEPFFCENGTYKIGPKPIHDAEPVGDTTLVGVLAKSSNICMAKLGARLGRERLHDDLVRFGFGKPTGIDLPGERAGLLFSVAKMGPLETATTSFGQGPTATPLQIATAYAALANGGTLWKPHVLRAIHDGDRRAQGPLADGRRIIDDTIAAAMRSMLYAVTQKGGTAQKLALPGYRYGGKTGTAQKVDPATHRYSDEKWASSFVGFAPLDDPRLVVYVVIDEPVGGHHGAEVAGPVFVETMNDALRWLGIRPTEPIATPLIASGELRVQASPPPLEPADGRMPDVRGLDLGDAVAKASRAGLRVEAVGSGVAVEQSVLTDDDGHTRLRVTFRPPS